MKRFVKSLLFPLLGVAALVVACERRPLVYMEEEGAKVVVKVLWKAEVYPEGVKPTGVTLYFFRDGQFYRQHTTADVDSCAVQLDPGTYKLYMISQSPEEYGQMEFEDMTDFDRASVRVVETKSRWYTRSSEDEELIANPELMTVGVSDEFVVSEEMVENYQFYNYNLRKRKKATKGEEENNAELTKAEELVNYYTIRVPVYPKSIVSQYWVTIYSDNVDVLKSVRASTSGMARSFELTQDMTGDDEGTQFITQWSLTIDDPFTRVGHIDGKITTFGFPHGETPSAQRDSTLNVSALLIDNSTVEDYVFNVGDRITAGDPPEGYRALYRLVFGSAKVPAIHPPDVRPDGESSGFDATVSDWEEGDKVDVVM